MTVLIILTTAGADTGPFNLYSDTDGFISAFDTSISRAVLLAGYTSTTVPFGTSVIRCVSEGTCTNYVDVSILLTSTTTTTIANPPTSILTFDSYSNGQFNFTLSNPIYSTPLEVYGAQVNGYGPADCSGSIINSDSNSISNPAIISSGSSSGSVIGTTPMPPSVGSYLKVNSITVNGYGTFVDGNTFSVDGTTVTVDIPNTCSVYTTTLYLGISLQYSLSSGTVCFTTPTLVYITIGSDVVTGNIIYTDTGLSIPLMGYTYIVNPFTNHIYNLNSSTGVIGSDTLLTC